MVLYLLAALPFAWVGHACFWTCLLNFVYARPYPKVILRPWRHLTGLVILSFPLGLYAAFESDRDWFEIVAHSYFAICLAMGAIAFPAITVARLLRKPPAPLVAESTVTLDLGMELGLAAIGNGKGRRVARLPFNGIFQVDFTELTLAIPNLPPEWHGLTILHLTDVHYHGTPSREFHERVMNEVQSRWPEPDLVCVTGDYVDTDEHHTWIAPMLGRFRGRDGNFAILGNHDSLHHPQQIRQSLMDAGYSVLGNGWMAATIRGVPCVFVGHEGPWFAPPPDLTAAPKSTFRFCLSHTPDNFYWGLRHGIGLMLCGHVHGGQIRLPIITSIFVPSMYSRRFDMGVFESAAGVMVVGRGLSGKEPLRIRCNPQVVRITLLSPTAP
jgi:uncharacterized protein